MYNKQDSIFWWTLDDYVKGDEKFKNLTIEQKGLIDQGFRLAYYGIFQYQLYIGRELQSIEPSSIQEISNYIVDNFVNLRTTVYKDKVKSLLELDTDEQKEYFLDLLENLVIPYINDHSFKKVRDFEVNKQSIRTLVLQLLFKNKYDINYKHKTEDGKLFYSPLYPYLITLAIVDPYSPSEMFANIKEFYTKEVIDSSYTNGRMITEAEENYLASNLDRIRNEEDFAAFLTNFTEDRWKEFDLKVRFRLIFQLSKFTAIILKEKIKSITMLEDGEGIFDLLESYLPLILKSKEEIAKDKKNNEYPIKEEQSRNFLYPISIKDFDPSLIEEYYEEMDIKKIDLDKKTMIDFEIGIVYALSDIRMAYQLNQACNVIGDNFISKHKVSLVNTLKIFNENADGCYVSKKDYFIKLDDLFIDGTSLSNIASSSKDIKKGFKLEGKLRTVLMAIAYLVSIDPSIVKRMDYSFDEMVKYYIICFGPYKKTKLGYDASEIKKFTAVVNKTIKYYKNIKHDEENDEYYEFLSILDKLVNFVKK